MYTKQLKEDLRLRLSKKDMDFLRKLSGARGVTVSECIRSIIGEYRRTLEVIDLVQDALKVTEKDGGLSDGDTKTYIDDIV